MGLSRSLSLDRGSFSAEYMTDVIAKTNLHNRYVSINTYLAIFLFDVRRVM